MTKKNVNQQTRRAKIKDQPFTNLLWDKGTPAGREDQRKNEGPYKKN
jgi:hypothetical protein